MYKDYFKHMNIIKEKCRTALELGTNYNFKPLLMDKGNQRKQRKITKVINT